MDQDLPEIFTEVFKTGSSKDLMTEGSELIIDSLLKNETLKDIPVVGSALNILKLGKAIKDISFQKKLLNFFSKTETISEDDRIDFIINLEDRTKQKAGEYLISYLDKLDHDKKALILGNLIIAKVGNKISIDDFLRLAHVLPRVFYFDLIMLPKYRKMKTTDAEGYDKLTASSLQDVGFITHGAYTGNFPEMHREIFQLEFGQLMAEHGQLEKVN